MRLTTLKLNGFKTFVDATTIDLLSSRTAVVGPNGCGKSNIVDAIRWVTGESSAKQLRTDDMAGVVFNGSSQRKPLGQASVELVFDNSQGRLGGAYSQYSQLSLRRQVTRDGQSTYMLNGTRCRRRDITDVLLGTGLGPRSYAIIEQGMIARLIEAKPEELRQYIEEASGISKYKERRAETERRIEHTRDNLSRLSDIQAEIERQLKHLQRQARQAERYKKLQQDNRSLSAQLAATCWRTLNEAHGHIKQQVSEAQTQYEAKTADLRRADAQITTLRDRRHEQTDHLDELQNQYYTVGTEIARLEQKINDAKERRQQAEQECARLTHTLNEQTEQLEVDQEQLASIKTATQAIEPEFDRCQQRTEQAKTQLNHLEEQLKLWQQQWQSFNEDSALTAQQVQVQQTKIQHLEQRATSAERRLIRLGEEREQLDTSAIRMQLTHLADQCEHAKSKLKSSQDKLLTLRDNIQAQRTRITELEEKTGQHRDDLQSKRATRTSLEALQEAALGKDRQAVTHWLETHQLNDKPRLAEQMTVKTGWARAVESVLGRQLEAICIDDFAHTVTAVSEFEEGQVFLFNTHATGTASKAKGNLPLLAHYVDTELPIALLLTDIYAAEDLEQAKAELANLPHQASIVTKDGYWLSPLWLRVDKSDEEAMGVLQREQQLKQLGLEIAELNDSVMAQDRQLNQEKQDLLDLEAEHDLQQIVFHESSERYRELHAEHMTLNARFEQLQARDVALTQEISDQEHELNEAKKQLIRSKMDLRQAMDCAEDETVHKAKLDTQRESLNAQVSEIRQSAQTYQSRLDALQLEMTRNDTQCQLLTQSIARSEQHKRDLLERQAQLDSSLESIAEPVQAWQADLSQQLGVRLAHENKLAEQRRQVQAIEHSLREQEAHRDEASTAITQARDQLERLHIEQETLTVQQQHHQDAVKELGFNLNELLEGLPDSEDTAHFEHQIAQLNAKIERLGPINLAAIDECAELSERKTYLDAQYNDLTTALETLESAITKIDQETKDQFKSTFEHINALFTELFPKVFKGGRASLELTGSDYLNTGVSVKAQPPGKRNTSIHLLSGGEKALTAIALVFSFFKLNPAPFCILDEVDAPLDDANVNRFCALVKEMSEAVQFIIVTHNKITMALAEQLVGITMQEPGVSRLVSVDIERALELAT